MFDIILGILATYGVSTIVSEYDGPLMAFERLRGNQYISVPECSVCLSPYVAVPIALILGLGLVPYLSVIGGTVLLARLK